MRIALSTDHAGFTALQKLEFFLERGGYECMNFGPELYDPIDDYPDFIKAAAQSVASGQCQFGIIFGGSGEGEAMVANKIPGIRCSVYYGPARPLQTIDASGTKAADEYEILRLSRSHNDANMLSLAGRFLDPSAVEKAVAIWLETPFSNEDRHLRRISKIEP